MFDLTFYNGEGKSDVKQDQKEQDLEHKNLFLSVSSQEGVAHEQVEPGSFGGQLEKENETEEGSKGDEQEEGDEGESQEVLEEPGDHDKAVVTFRQEEAATDDSKEQEEE